MSLPTSIRDREYRKFCDIDPDGKKTAVRICADDDIPISGSFTFSGLSTAQKNTMLEVSTTAVALPAIALTNRNTISVRNLSTTDILYIGGSDVEANENVGTTAGWQVGPNETYNVDITDSIVIYGRVASGTIKVQVRELA